MKREKKMVSSAGSKAALGSSSRTSSFSDFSFFSFLNHFACIFRVGADADCSQSALQCVYRPHRCHYYLHNDQYPRGPV